MCFLGEIKNPGKNIPKSLITGIPMVAAVYLLANVSYLAVLTPKEIVSAGMNVSRQRGNSHYCLF